MYVVKEVKVRYLSVFECATCHRVAPGETRDTTQKDVEAAIKVASTLNPNDMPAGWGSYGNAGFRCPKCIT